jgi:hypothetical protein
LAEVVVRSDPPPRPSRAPLRREARDKPRWCLRETDAAQDSAQPAVRCQPHRAPCRPRSSAARPARRQAARRQKVRGNSASVRIRNYCASRSLVLARRWQAQYGSRNRSPAELKAPPTGGGHFRRRDFCAPTSDNELEPRSSNSTQASITGPSTERREGASEVGWEPVWVKWTRGGKVGK